VYCQTEASLKSECEHSYSGVQKTYWRFPVFQQSSSMNLVLKRNFTNRSDFANWRSVIQKDAEAIVWNPWLGKDCHVA
jgi:hypothetical protein